MKTVQTETIETLFGDIHFKRYSDSSICIMQSEATKRMERVLNGVSLEEYVLAFLGQDLPTEGVHA